MGARDGWRGDRPWPRLAYAESPPGRGLEAYVHSFWTFDAEVPAGGRFEHHVWPDGCVSVVIVSPGVAPPLARVVGPHAGPRMVPIQECVRCRGVRFRPEAGGPVLGVSAGHLRGRAQPLADLLGSDAAALAERVAEPVAHREGLGQLRAWVSRRVANAAVTVDPLVAQAVDAIIRAHGRGTISALAAGLGLGRRQFERRFQRSVGVSPKQFARIRRMRSLIAAVLDHRASWVARAADLGYADQAHCTRELSRLTGLSPRALETRLHAIEHHGVKP